MTETSTDELLAFLNELLEAERAGVRVTQETAAEIADAELRAVVEAVRLDEAKWCAVLVKAITKLAGQPSKRVGAFHEKAMAIAEIPARLTFLNRGQGWVVRKLREWLPRIADEEIRRDLTEMLICHERNIALVEERQA